MTPPHDPIAHDDPPDDGLGPELLAHVRGELDADRASEIDALLAASAELRAEREQLAADHAAWSSALIDDVPSPAPAVLYDLLATIADEAAERRARVATALAPFAAEAGEAAVALGMDQLDGAERAHAERLIAEDPRLADECAATRRLVAATRSALALEPRPETLPALLAQVAEVGPAPVQFDTQDVPLPSHRPRGRLRVLGWLAPLAAVIVMAIALQPTPPGTACVQEGTAFIAERTAEDDAARRGRWIDAADGAFDLDYGDVIGAGSGPLTIRVACGADGAAPSSNGTLSAGAAEFVLEPGARLARVDAAHFDLLSGRVRVTAKELENRLEVRSGTLYAAVTGTRFDVTAIDGRLFVIVEDGTVLLGRRGSDPDSVAVHAGEQGMADAQRLASAPLDGRTNGDTFLTPRATLEGPSAPLSRDAALSLEARLVVGDGGPVTIAGFDASVPLFLVRLTGPEGREREIKIQESMLTVPPPTEPDTAAAGTAGSGVWRLTAERPYELSLRMPGLELEPGRWEARLRYMSYRSRGPTSGALGSNRLGANIPGSEAGGPGATWLGAVESAPVRIEVTAR